MNSLLFFVLRVLVLHKLKSVLLTLTRASTVCVEAGVCGRVETKRTLAVI
uniref:Uncharacterized protein n=1 Tax=Anguilla anguilla TaxID=7936 RepID=A0A0E9WQX8_ANGAN